MQSALDELRQLRKRKEESLESAADRADDHQQQRLTAARPPAQAGPLRGRAQARRVCAALTRQRPCRNRPGRKQQA